VPYTRDIVCLATHRLTFAEAEGFVAAPLPADAGEYAGLELAGDVGDGLTAGEVVVFEMPGPAPCPGDYVLVRLHGEYQVRQVMAGPPGHLAFVADSHKPDFIPEKQAKDCILGLGVWHAGPLKRCPSPGQNGA